MPSVTLATGTAGNDLLMVPAGTTAVNGEGGSDSVTLRPYQYFAEYQITRNANGSITVTDQHGGSLIDTVMTGISTLEFADGDYVVATGQFFATAKLVNATAANQFLTVPAGTQLVNGCDGVDTAVLGPYQYFDEFKILANADGSLSVTDQHAGSLINTKMVGISLLEFADGTYDVARSAFIPNAEIVNATSASQTLTLPAGTLLVNGEGGSDTVALGPYQYYANYQIIHSNDGSILVSDLHGGSITDTVMVGITTLQFSDGSYTVATSQFSPTVPVAPTSPTTPTTPTTPTIPTTPTSPVVPVSGLLTAPVVEAAQTSHDIVAVRIDNSGKTALSSRVITFGQTFADGGLANGASLVASINGVALTVQVDVKTTNADGSVAYAILTVQAPALAVGASDTVMLSRSATPVVALMPLSPAGFTAAGYDQQVALTIHNANGSTTLDQINVGAALNQALAKGTVQNWLSGPLASEDQFTVAINASMNAQFNIRENADGTFVTTVQILNNGVFSTASRSYTYDITITSHGHTLANQTGVVEAPMQDWSQTLWSNATGAATAPTDHLVYDVAYLEKTGAISAYTTTAGVSAAAIAAQQTALASAATGPLGNDLVLQYQPTTGARPDIGPTTQWAADWLVSQSAAAEQVMLANANAAYSQPIHAVNANGTPLTTANDPGFWLDYRNTTNPLTVNYGSIETQSDWTMDANHIADLSYLTALSTGSEVALQQVQAQANYDLLVIAPGYRATDSTQIGLQERGIAWTIRDVANAAFLTPNTDPQKAYYTTQIDALISNLDTNYVHGALGAAEGKLQGYILGAFDGNQVAPWEQGYIVIALGQAASQGISGATEVLAWMNNFISGLYLNGANGYNPLDGSGYWLTIGTGSLATSNLQDFTTWQQVFNANFAGQATPTSLYGFPDDPVGGFSTIAKAALAVEWNVTHAPQDLAAFAYITQQTSSLVQSVSGYASAETWNIAPTLVDGHQLQNSEVYYGNGGTTNATTTHGLLAAASGNNILQAGGGDSILIGGSGTDRLNGGAGDDFLFAGTGAQTLYGAGGTNYLQGHLNGGVGVDLFIFKVSDMAQDKVVGFIAATDKIEISGASHGMTAATLLASATIDSAGDVVLHLSSLHEVALVGIAPGHLAAQSLSFI